MHVETQVAKKLPLRPGHARHTSVAVGGALGNRTRWGHAPARVFPRAARGIGRAAVCGKLVQKGCARLVLLIVGTRWGRLGGVEEGDEAIGLLDRHARGVQVHLAPELGRLSRPIPTSSSHRGSPDQRLNELLRPCAKRDLSRSPARSGRAPRDSALRHREAHRRSVASFVALRMRCTFLELCGILRRAPTRPCGLGTSVVIIEDRGRARSSGRRSAANGAWRATRLQRQCSHSPVLQHLHVPVVSKIIQPLLHTSALLRSLASSLSRCFFLLLCALFLGCTVLRFWGHLVLCFGSYPLANEGRVQTCWAKICSAGDQAGGWRTGILDSSSCDSFGSRAAIVWGENPCSCRVRPKRGYWVHHESVLCCGTQNPIMARQRGESAQNRAAALPRRSRRAHASNESTDSQGRAFYLMRETCRVQAVGKLAGMPVRMQACKDGWV